MFAILISPENMPKIIESSTLSESEVTHYVPSYFQHPTGVTKQDWYFVTGYVSATGVLKDWVILPAYILATNFEYDTDKMKTDWDQIVRK